MHNKNKTSSLKKKKTLKIQGKESYSIRTNYKHVKKQ